ncbi:LacI family DNA-binding transcriptional regulator [Alginatibacterium sediminis]|uniref:LacI family DNA-binding transcriptional regulator n=1 Tax=Alginatibacterium sediminis TaxID=2164068 RepID=A0A420EDC0_9ALTE|nr:LacI family DNA-binding transcriptional regulator [Alginatibacterium sediminis]RKF18668.1 LacI family DNA-binding transcriptional regulator [Alginatibacterium sediminis]
MSHKPLTTITAQDVASKAGVSRAVVSRTFSKNGSVSHKSRTKVLAAASELGYQVNVLAQSLNRQRSNLIGLVTARLSDPYRGALLESLVHQIQSEGYQVLVSEMTEKDDMESTLTKFTQLRVSGVIVTSGYPPIELVGECVRLNIPVVVINRETDISNVDVVMCDNHSGAAMAARAMIDSGRTKLAYLGIEQGTFSALDRGTGFVESIATALALGRVSYQHLQAKGSDYDAGKQAALEYLGAGLNFDGLFCANDLLACGFIDGAKALFNLHSPEHFSIIGFDDIPTAGFDAYQLTTLRQDTKAIACAALTRLHHRAKNQDIPQVIDKIGVELIQRNTL